VAKREIRIPARKACCEVRSRRAHVDREDTDGSRVLTQGVPRRVARPAAANKTAAPPVVSSAGFSSKSALKTPKEGSELLEVAVTVTAASCRRGSRSRSIAGCLLRAGSARGSGELANPNRLTPSLARF
jgi:hypothetical protein